MLHSITSKETEVNCRYFLCDGGLLSVGSQTKARFLFADTDLFCYECDKTFKAVSSYRRHMRDYHGDANSQHQCEYCEKVFRTKGLLINHKSAEHRSETQAIYLMNPP